ncbi:hypothetical protein Bca4012_087367 [Brassica carinata]
MFFLFGVYDDENFILKLKVGLKNVCIDDQADTVTFFEGYQDISRRGITHDSYESEVWHYNIGVAKRIGDGSTDLDAP